MAEPAKTADDESFPVASRFLAPAIRPVVLTFYRFARRADDIADDPGLDPERKLAVLHAADGALAGARVEDGPGTHPAVAAAAALREALDARDVPVDHARHLLQAFVRDATQRRYTTWSDLMLYCSYSAAPVGRFLLDLHGESRQLWKAADALCGAHQVLNHIQDAGADYRRLDRVYLPERWLAAEGIETDALGADRSVPALRRVLDRCLEHTDSLLDTAEPLIPAIRDRGLAAQASVTLALGRALRRKLARRDPLRHRVRLSKLAVARGALTGFLAARRSRAA